MSRQAGMRYGMHLAGLLGGVFLVLFGAVKGGWGVLKRHTASLQKLIEQSG